MSFTSSSGAGCKAISRSITKVGLRRKTSNHFIAPSGGATWQRILANGVPSPTSSRCGPVSNYSVSQVKAAPNNPIQRRKPATRVRAADSGRWASQNGGSQSESAGTLMLDCPFWLCECRAAGWSLHDWRAVAATRSARHDRSLRRQGRLQCQSIKGCGRWLWPDILSTKNRYSDLEGLAF